MENRGFQRDYIKEEYPWGKKIAALERVMSHPFSVIVVDIEGTVALSQNTG